MRAILSPRGARSQVSVQAAGFANAVPARPADERVELEVADAAGELDRPRDGIERDRLTGRSERPLSARWRATQKTQAVWPPPYRQAGWPAT